MGGPDRPSPTRGPLRRWVQAAGEVAVVGGVTGRRKLYSAVAGGQQHTGIPLIRGRAEPLGGHRPEGILRRPGGRTCQGGGLRSVEQTLGRASERCDEVGGAAT